MIHDVRVGGPLVRQMPGKIGAEIRIDDEEKRYHRKRQVDGPSRRLEGEHQSHRAQDQVHGLERLDEM